MGAVPVDETLEDSSISYHLNLSKTCLVFVKE